MSSDEKTLAQGGDWVLVWGQVVKPDIIDGETSVQFENHNSQYEGLVRNAHMVLGQGTPPDVQRCAALAVCDGTTSLYTRCISHHRHPDRHRDEHGQRWSDEGTIGYMEDR